MPRRDDFDDDLLDPSEEAFDYKPVESESGRGGKGLKLFLTVTVLAGLAGGAWYFVGNSNTSSDNIPVVRADTAPTKEKPSDPGGMSVPNRDKTVYNRVSGENTEPKLERLLPRPEKPLEKPVAGMALPELSETVSEETGMPAISKELPMQEEARDVAQAAEQKMTNPVSETPALPEEPTEEMANEVQAPPPAPVIDENAPRALVKRSEQSAGPDQQDKDDLAKKIAEALNDQKQTDGAPAASPVKPVEVAKVTLKPEAKKPAAKPVTPKSGYLLQLLSSKSESGVKSTWQKIKSKNGDIVGNLPANVVKADLGAEKGIYYRLRLGPVSTGDQAKSLCSQLKKRKVGCFIVRVR